MAHWKTAKYAQYLNQSNTVSEVNCKSEECPRFQTCTQVPSHARLGGKTKAKVFFVADGITQDEDELRTPACGLSGKILRDVMIRVFMRNTQQAVPYLITKTFRAMPGPPKAQEAALCFNHLLKEMRFHTPDVVVALGVAAFQALYAQASNREHLPLKHEQTQQNLRGRFFDFDFSGLKTKVFVSYSPGAVATAPASVPLLLEDANVLSSHWSPQYRKMLVQPLKINKIESLKTVKEVFDYLEFLRCGLKSPTLVSFDTETRNLNKRWNNHFLTWQFSHEEGTAVVFPIEHRDNPLFKDPKLKAELAGHMNLLLNSTTAQTKINWMVGHNHKFDLATLYGLMGILPRVQNCIPWWCTMLGMHWLDENRKSRSASLSGSPYSLKTIGTEQFGFKFEEDSLEKRGDGTLEDLPYLDLVTYGGSDSILTRALAYRQLELAALEQDQEVKRIDEAIRNSKPRPDKPGDPVKNLKMFQKYYYFPASRAISVMECNGLFVKPEQLQYLQSEESPIWNRLSEIEKTLQNLPDVLEFRRRFKDKISGAKKDSSEYETQLWSFAEDDDLPELDFNKAEHQRLFFLDYLKLPIIRISKKTKKPSFNNAFLEHYAKEIVYKETPTIKERFYNYYGVPLKDEGVVYRDNPIKLAIEYRKLKKLGTAYLDSIEGYIRNPVGDCVDSRVRASYNLHGTDTGRLSSSQPNLQQLPSGKIKLAKEVKNMFQAHPPTAEFPHGTCLIQGDYKTAEVRWAALFSGDKNLIKVFQEAAKIIAAAVNDPLVSDEDFERAELSSDLHRRTASLMFNVPAEQVPKHMRQAAKSITFGLLFGMTTKTLAEREGWTLEEAEEKMKSYFSAFPDLERWLKEIPREAESRGYVETFMGRRRRLDHLFMIDEWKFRTEAERKAMNSSIQGQSSDAGTIGMFTFMQYVLDNGLEQRWLVQNVVHDSCLVQVPLEDIEKALDTMRQCFVADMQAYIERIWKCALPIPIEMEFEIGLKYGDLAKWDGRKKTLDKILQDIKTDTKEVWKIRTPSLKPPKALDLVTFEG